MGASHSKRVGKEAGACLETLGFRGQNALKEIVPENNFNLDFITTYISGRGISDSILFKIIRKNDFLKC